MIAVRKVIDVALTPVLGVPGLVALYQRTLYLSAESCAGLAELPELRKEFRAAATSAALQLLIARQTPDMATALGASFVQTFHGLVVIPVGPSLTEQLLHNAWTHAPSDSPTQDTLP